MSSSGFVVRIVTNGKLRNGMHAFILQARDASKVGAMNAFGTFTGLVLANETVEGIYMPVRCSGRIGDTMIWTTGTAAGGMRITRLLQLLQLPDCLYTVLYS